MPGIDKELPGLLRNLKLDADRFLIENCKISLWNIESPKLVFFKINFQKFWRFNFQRHFCCSSKISCSLFHLFWRQFPCGQMTNFSTSNASNSMKTENILCLPVGKKHDPCLFLFDNFRKLFKNGFLMCADVIFDVADGGFLHSCHSSRKTSVAQQVISDFTFLLSHGNWLEINFYRSLTAPRATVRRIRFEISKTAFEISCRKALLASAAVFCLDKEMVRSLLLSAPCCSASAADSVWLSQPSFEPVPKFVITTRRLRKTFWIFLRCVVPRQSRKSASNRSCLCSKNSCSRWGVSFENGRFVRVLSGHFCTCSTWRDSEFELQTSEERCTHLQCVFKQTDKVGLQTVILFWKISPVCMFPKKQSVALLKQKVLCSKGEYYYFFLSVNWKWK